MSNKSDSSSSKKTEESADDVGGFLKAFSPNSTFADYVKRFFYQIIGIYFPASILFLYIFLFWFVGPNHFDTVKFYRDQGNFKEGWPKHIGNNTAYIMQQENANGNTRIIPLILFLIAIVILGEGINALSARVTKLSPITTSIPRSIKFSILESSFPSVYKAANWPIWLNETSFPVSFAQFDRYYVSALEQDKRTLAGKIGWVSFYRNMVAVFAFILILQAILTSLTGFHGYEYYVFTILAAAILLLFFGYRAQVRSNSITLWDAYKRYQLRKNLEIRYGDLALSLGIKDKYKTRALEYMVDRWFLGVDNTIQTVSRHFLTKLEKEYARLYELSKDKRPQLDFIAKAEEKLREKLSSSYSNWNKGAYERVIVDVFKAFDIIRKAQDECKKDRSIRSYADKLGKHIPKEQDWKAIQGFYTLENSLRTDAAFLEILKNISDRKWAIIEDKEVTPKDNSNSSTSSGAPPSPNPNDSVDRPKDLKRKVLAYYTPRQSENKEDYDDLANLIRETSDEYQKAFFQVMHVLKILHKLLIQNKLKDDQKHQFFKRMYELCGLFGGYEYDKAFDYAKTFFDKTSLNGTLDITLKHKDILSKSHFGEYVRKQSEDDVWINAFEGALVTEVINPSPYRLNNIFHVEPDGSRSDLGDLNPYSSLNINENQRKIIVSGEWSVTSLESTNLKAPQEIPIRISWNIQMEKAQMFIENILMSEKVNNITVETTMKTDAARQGAGALLYCR